MTVDEARIVWKDCMEWLNLLGLTHWDIGLCLYDTTAKYQAAYGSDPTWRSSANTSVSWEYMHATISVDLEKCERESIETLQRMFLHEVAHIFVHEMRSGTRCDCEWDIRPEERVCTMLSHALYEALHHKIGTDDARNIRRRPKSV